jgi:trk system potassium uptake protein
MTWARIAHILSLLAVLVDLLLATLPTGALAYAGILFVTAGITGAGGRALGTRQAGPLQVALVAALVAFAVARGYALIEQLIEPAAAPARTYSLVWLGLAAGSSVALKERAQILVLAQSLSAHPARVLAGSFAALIVVATLLLALPVSVNDVAAVSFLDALFTATSAVCVTGLAVNDIGATYTRFGQAVILGAVQLGGIGIMTLAAFALTLMKDAGLSDQSRYARLLQADGLAELKGLVRGVVVGTLLFEAAGALALWGLWSEHPRLSGEPVWWWAVFHSVSAFCNAGFSLFSTSLVPLALDPLSQIVLMTLIVTGGLGFPVWRGVVARAGGRLPQPLRRRLWRDSARPVRLELGARVALVVTFVLIAAGTVSFLVLEATGALRHLGVAARVLNALFCSVTARTAGFNTVDFGSMADGTLLVCMVLMFIGGSPGSTAGGIKTTSAAVIGATLVGELRGHEPRLFGRTLPTEVLRRASAVAAISITVVATSLFLLSLTEDHSFRSLAFEAVSAFATAGLSMGITADLSVAGKLIIAITMFIGRTGPLTLALAVARPHRPPLHRPAQESLPIG